MSFFDLSLMTSMKTLVTSFTYTTPRFVSVDIWQIGLLYRLGCVGILTYVLWQMFASGSYSESDAPLGSINAWSEGLKPGINLFASGAFSYCSSATHDYIYSPNFRYIQPACRVLSWTEVVTKSIDSLSFTTGFIETSVLKWRCGDESSNLETAAKLATCSQLGSSVVSGGASIEFPDGNPAQCSCTATQPLYVKGVEDMVLAFEHSYETRFATDDADSNFREDDRYFSGVSGRAACANGEGGKDGGSVGLAGCVSWPLNTRVSFGNGSVVDFMGGATVALSLREVIALAGSSGIDDVNYDATPDCRDASVGVSATGSPAYGPSACTDLGSGTPDSPRYPRFRTTGMRFTVDLLYTNRVGYYDSQEAAASAPFFSRNVTTQMNVSQERVGWAGMGAQTFVLEVPTYSDVDGVESSAKLTRYRQGVLLSFRPSGKIYYFSLEHFFQTLLEGMLLLGLVQFVMNMIVFFILPNGMSTVLSNKRQEKVSKTLSFAQMGVRAASNIQSFNALDTNGDGYLEVKDLVRSLAAVPGMSRTQALEVAQTVLKVADVEKDEGSADGRISFNEYMSLLEGSTAMDFNGFVSLVHTTGEVSKLDQDSVLSASQEYDNVVEMSSPGGAAPYDLTDVREQQTRAQIKRAKTVNVPVAAYQTSVTAAVTIQRHARGKIARAMTLEKRAIYVMKERMPSPRASKESIKSMFSSSSPGGDKATSANEVVIDVPG